MSGTDSTPITNDDAASSDQSSHKSKSENSGAKDYDLPRANVYRIVKKVLPEGILLVNDSKIAFSKAAVVFIMYLTAA
jgi:histone H3/H4